MIAAQIFDHPPAALYEIAADVLAAPA